MSYRDVERKRTRSLAGGQKAPDTDELAPFDANVEPLSSRTCSAAAAAPSIRSSYEARMKRTCAPLGISPANVMLSAASLIENRSDDALGGALRRDGKGKAERRGGELVRLVSEVSAIQREGELTVELIQRVAFGSRDLA